MRDRKSGNERLLARLHVLIPLINVGWLQRNLELEADRIDSAPT